MSWTLSNLAIELFLWVAVGESFIAEMNQPSGNHLSSRSSGWCCFVGDDPLRIANMSLFDSCVVINTAKLDPDLFRCLAYCHSIYLRVSSLNRYTESTNNHQATILNHPPWTNHYQAYHEPTINKLMVLPNLWTTINLFG